MAAIRMTAFDPKLTSAFEASGGLHTTRRSHFTILAPFAGWHMEPPCGNREGGGHFLYDFADARLSA